MLEELFRRCPLVSYIHRRQKTAGIPVRHIFMKRKHPAPVPHTESGLCSDPLPRFSRRLLFVPKIRAKIISVPVNPAGQCPHNLLHLTIQKQYPSIFLII